MNKVGEREHALLSASASSRWLACTPAPRLEDTLPESTSPYAEEGRLAHAIAELKLQKYVAPMPRSTYRGRLNKLKSESAYQAEMDRYTDAYFNYIAELSHSFSASPIMAVEKRVDYSEWVPEGFGTCDFVMIGDGMLYAIDFKYGKGVAVSAHDNPQLKLYALGVWSAYGMLYAIDKIKLVIVQPRLSDEPSVYELTLDELLAWGESIKPIAQKAYAGEGDHVPGEHCRFCRAKALCRARSDFAMSIDSAASATSRAAKDAKGGEALVLNKQLLDNVDVGDLLGRAKVLVAWVKDLEEYALSEALAGREISGWKVVAGRSNRAFVDAEKAFEALKLHGIDETLLYERKPLTLTQVETLVGKAKFKSLLSGLVHKPPGKPTLVPEGDKREAFTRTSAAEDFQNN